MNGKRHLLASGAVGALVAVIMLVVMAVFAVGFWPLEVEFPGMEILTGEVPMAPDKFIEFANLSALMLSLDSIFIIGVVLAWLGLGVLTRERAGKMGWLVVILGVTGAILDFCENQIGWSMVQVRLMGASAPVDAVPIYAYFIISALSYLFPFTAAALAGVWLWGERIRERLLTLVGTVLMVPALFGLFVPSLSVASFMWFLVWFGVVGVVLFQESRHL
ncbi:MAG: hypothetical protein JW885_11980 [Deltaproteobacteria bacterium]|nr:hypothetical protein [Candidatus Zymogenaceae bacterium]